MIGTLFSVKYYSYECDGWEAKKAELLKHIDPGSFERAGSAQFATDRHSEHEPYVEPFVNIFSDELNRFGVDANLRELDVRSIWSVRYRRGDYHSVHNHRSTGYSGILYLDYDDRVHTPSIHVSPWNDPASDMTVLMAPPVREGTIVFAPSNVLHYTRPNNSDTERAIVAFDMEVR